MVEKIRNLCSQNGISLNDLERQIDGVGINTIYRWDSSSPNAARLSAVADFFGVSVDWLLDRQDSLTDDETALIANFRRLTETQKDAVQALMLGFLSQNPVKKETGIS